MNQDEMKQAVAQAALDYIRPKIEDDTVPVSYTHLTLPTNVSMCRSRWGGGD